jgi:hypothetical protein
LPLGLRSLILDHTWPARATAAYGAWLQAGAAAEGRLLWCERAVQQGQQGGQAAGGAGVGAKRPRKGVAEPRPPPVPLFDVRWLPQHLGNLRVTLPTGTRVLNAPGPAPPEPAQAPGTSTAQPAGGPPTASGAGPCATAQPVAGPDGSGTSAAAGQAGMGGTAGAGPSGGAAAAGPSTAAAGPGQAGGQGQPGWQQPGWWPRLEVVAAPEGGGGGAGGAGPAQPGGGAGGEAGQVVLRLRPSPRPPAEDSGGDGGDEEGW